MTSQFSYALFASCFCLLLVVEPSLAQTHYKLVFLAGQSNARGAINATDFNELPTEPVNLQLPQKDVLFFSNDGALLGPTALQPGSGVGSVAFGPEIAFGRTVADAMPNSNLGIVKHAESATDLEEDWDPDAAGINSYDRFLNTASRAMDSITNNGDTFEIVGFLWVQGEGDANRDFGDTYEANLINFIQTVRDEFGADMPFYISQLSDNQAAGLGNDEALVRQAQQDVAAADDNTFLIDTDGPQFTITPAPDNLHYDSNGQVVLGEALAFSFLSDSITVLDESFSGTGGPLNNSFAEMFDAAIIDAGGSSIWSASADFLDNGDVVSATGNSSAFLNLGSYINDTKGQSNGLFRLQWTVSDITTSGNRWIGGGFSDEVSPANNSHFLTEGGTANLILRSAGGADGFVPGLSALAGPMVNNTAHRLRITLDLRSHNGIDDFGTVTFATDQSSFPVAIFEYTSDQDFSSLLLSNNSDTAGTISNLTLTQTGPAVLLGDVNCDGILNLLDVQPFVELISTGGFSLKADVNIDGVVNLLDVGPFVDLLSGG